MLSFIYMHITTMPKECSLFDFIRQYSYAVEKMLLLHFQRMSVKSSYSRDGLPKVGTDNKSLKEVFLFDFWYLCYTVYIRFGFLILCTL